MSDNVEHPNHYTTGAIECIEAIEAAVDNPVDYYRGTCLKYIWRSGRKHESDAVAAAKSVEDLKKAAWYLDRWIRHLKGADAVERDLLYSVAALREVVEDE